MKKNIFLILSIACSLSLAGDNFLEFGCDDKNSDQFVTLPCRLAVELPAPPYIYDASLDKWICPQTVC